MPAPAKQDSSTVVGVADLGAGLRRHARLIAACTALGVLTGLLLYAVLDRSYEARATVEVGNSVFVTEGGALSAPINTATERQIALSGSVIARVVAALPEPVTVSEFLERAEVLNPPESTTLVLAVSSSSPQAAADDANAWAKEYLEYRSAQTKALVDTTVAQLDDLIDAARAALQDSAQRVNEEEEGSVAQLDALSARQSAQDQLSSLLSRRTQVLAAAVDPGSVISVAEPPKGPSGLGLPAYLVGGALLGAIAGAMIALIRSRPGTRLRSSNDLPSDIGWLVVLDLSMPAPRQQSDLAALGERVREASDDAAGGVEVAVLDPDWSELALFIADGLSSQGVDASATSAPRVPARSIGGQPSRLLLTSCEGSDPWLPILSASSTFVAVIAVLGHTTELELRSTLTAIGGMTSAPIGVVVVSASSAEQLRALNHPDRAGDDLPEGAPR
jgi:hypothetical protein